MILRRSEIFHVLFYSFSLFIGTSVFSNENINNNYSFHQVSVEQGLPGTNVLDIFQDSKGLIWLSIESKGVCKYNGHTFDLLSYQINQKNTLSSNFINDISEDDSCFLWFATENGLNRYNRKNRKIYTYKKDTVDNPITEKVLFCIKKNKEGKFWIGGASGLILFDPLRLKIEKYYTLTNSDHEHYSVSVFDILIEKDSVLWLGTNNGLIKFNPENNNIKKWQKRGINNEPLNNIIFKLVQDNNDRLWLATRHGLDCFNIIKESFTGWKYNNELDNTQLNKVGIYSLLKDNKNKLWVATFSMGLVIVDLEDDSYIRINNKVRLKNPIKSSHIRCLYQDKSDIVWIGTKYEGLYKYVYNNGIFSKWPEIYKLIKSIENIYIKAFAEDNEGNFWLGTKYDGVYKINIIKNLMVNYRNDINSQNSLSSNHIHSIYNDSKGRIWVNTESGLNLYNKKENNFNRVSNFASFVTIEDRLGNIWSGTSSGCFNYNRNKGLIRYSFDTSDFFRRTDIEIISMAEDNYNNIWYCSRNKGIYRYNADSKILVNVNKTYELFKKVSGNTARTLFEDEDHNIWIGTKSDGLLKYDYHQDSFSQFTILDGMPSNTILAINQDLSGNLWLGTGNGISKYSIYKNEVNNYGEEHGIKSVISEINLSYRFENGNLLFGGNRGFNIFYPDNIYVEDSATKIIISSIKVFNEEIDADITKPIDLVLNYDQNYISFEFALDDYRNPYKHEYKCFFKGVDKDWISLNNTNLVNYNNIDPGRYILYVNGTNVAGKWNNEPLYINVRIKSPLIATWYFKIIMGLLLIIVVILFYYQKSTQISKNREYLEKEIKERTLKLSEAYQELLSKNEMIESQKKEIENHKIILEAKVLERTRDLEHAKRKAEESDHLKSAFLANMSHEIRTPINAIAGFSNLLYEEDVSNDEKRNYVKIIDDNTNVLLKLIEDILDISKIEAGQLKIKKSIFNLNSVLEDLYNLYNGKIKGTSKEILQFNWINIKDKNNYLGVFTDQLRFKQIISNLLSNAIKYTHKGTIEFGYEIIENNLKLYVKDSGIGIAEKDLNSIFERFIKLEDSMAFYRGTGIGLSISKGLTELLGGKIWVESEPGQGSCFYVELIDIVDYKISEEKNSRKRAHVNLDLQQKSILVIEDEDSNFALINSYLKKTGVNIMRAVDGEDAIEICKSHLFDLLLLDIKMPKMDGYEAITLLRKDYPELPIIAQTAYAMAEDKEKIIKYGFTDYLAKPILKTELFNVLCKYL